MTTTQPLPITTPSQSITALRRQLKAKYPAATFNLAEHHDHIWLYNLGVKRDFRGRGIGTSLMREIKAYCAGVNKPLRLAPVPGHQEDLFALMRFYTRLGFRERNGLFELEWRPSPH
jgi:GNAT superfamily N-acetyltransferase